LQFGLFRLHKIFITIFLFFSFNSQASFLNGQELYDYCTSNEISEINFCTGFISGVLETYVDENENDYNDYVKKNQDEGFKKCDTTKITSLGQAKDVVTNFLKINPKKRNETGQYLAKLSIMDWLNCGTFGDVKIVFETSFGYKF